MRVIKHSLNVGFCPIATGTPITDPENNSNANCLRKCLLSILRPCLSETEEQIKWILYPFIPDLEISLKRILATIGYGWESVEFYTKWMYGDEKIARSITGAYLELGGIQSQYAQNFLEVFKATLTDEYVNTIKKHYRMFKKLRS